MPVRILVADDSAIVRQVICRLLRERLGWEIVGEAADGENAVKLAKQLSPDLIVLDFLMPGLNGIEAAREIVRASPNVPIMLCTMYLSPQLLDLAKNAGVTGTLSKSNLGQLIPGIETILSGSTYFSPAS